jgi:CheY-like chemotaxis protein
MVKKYGARCDTALNGKEALFAADRRDYDIYFIDYRMPDIDGLELAVLLKEKVGAPVVLMSAVEWSEIADEAKKAEVDRFLPKPLFPSKVESMINDCLGIARPEMDNKEYGKTAAGQFSGYRILLAEDIEVNREIVLALLEPTLLEIDCAKDGAIAVKMFAESPKKYDVIFMDIQMPEMDGYEATRRIRAMNIPEAKTIPIIAMTANVFREDIEKCLETGMNSHLGKPLDIDEVFDKLRTYLPKRDESG